MCSFHANWPAESVKPVDEFDVYISDGEVIVHSAVGGSELTNTAKSGKIKEKQTG